MTREEARKKAEIMLAYADGKEIELYDAFAKKWIGNENPAFDAPCDYYRVKTEPKYRPFKKAEECFDEMKKHEPFGWIENQSKGFSLIAYVVKNGIHFSDGSFLSYDWAFTGEHLKFADGTPFGIKEEES